MGFNQDGSNVNNPQQGLNTNAGFLGNLGNHYQSNNAFTQTPPVQNATHPVAPTAQPIKHTVVTDPATGKSTTTQTFSPEQESANSNVTGVLAPTAQNPGGLAPNNPANKYNTSTGLLNTNYKDPTTPPPTTTPPATDTPAPLTVAGQAPGVLATGNQTGNESTTYNGLLNSANSANDPNSRISQAYQTKQNLENEYANQEKAIQGSPIPLQFQQGRGQILANQYGQQEQAAQTGISNALAGQGQQISGLTAANTAAQTTAQRGTQTAENVLGAVAPQQTGILSGIYQPGTNTYGQTAGSAAGANGPAGAGAIETQVGQGGIVQTQTGNQSQAQALTQQLNSTIQSSGFNSLSGGITTQALNGINQWINNQSGDPQYQNAYNLIGEIASKYSNILNASGGTPTDVSTTTHNIINGLASGKSIQQVIGDLDANATQSINALRGSSQNNAVTNPTQNNSLYNF